MKIILLLLLVVFIAISCEIQLDGNRFYTVQGKLLDTTNQPIKNHHLQVITSKGALFDPYERIILNNGYTNENGYFKIYYPGSSHHTYLDFEPEFYKYDSISSDGHVYGYHTEIELDDENYPENYIDLGNLKIKKEN